VGGVFKEEILWDRKSATACIQHQREAPCECHAAGVCSRPGTVEIPISHIIVASLGTGK